MISTDPTHSLTLILPCAGKGSRLAIHGPKELMELGAGVRQIDLSLAHIRYFLGRPASTRIETRVAVVITPEKEEVYRYVAKTLRGVRVHRVYFDSRYHEWPGSVFSAREQYGSMNVVLLPDSILQMGAGNVTGGLGRFYASGDNRSLLEWMVDGLLKSSVVFGVRKCENPHRLRSLGAVRVREAKVVAFQDKPQVELEKYNGFWCSYGFRHRVAADLYHYLSASVRKAAPPFNVQTFFPPGVVEVTGYEDLGTWEAIQRVRGRYDFLQIGETLKQVLPWRPGAHGV